VQVSRNEWKYVAELELSLDPRIGQVPCYEGELKQALLNMVVNAAHAVQERRTADPSAPAGLIGVRTELVGQEVVITVQDNGIGMDDATRARIFDPFFTTKDVGHGTGQGLSTAHATVVQKHGGRIEVTSAPGVGTTFTVALPLAAPGETAPGSESNGSDTNGAAQ
jgi:signal transduction histidine kinase